MELRVYKYVCIKELAAEQKSNSDLMIACDSHIQRSSKKVFDQPTYVRLVEWNYTVQD